jgi:hypothetical protein
MNETIVVYLVGAMLSWVPLHALAPFESAPDARARYESIARDAISVAFDPQEAPLFPGREGRLETAVLMLSVASYESGFRRRVDDGLRRGDNGLSYCLMQLRVGTGVTLEGWSAKDLVADRRLCFRAALHMMRYSFAACANLPIEDGLSVYATGRCIEGTLISKSRILRARSWWQAHTPPAAM